MSRFNPVPLFSADNSIRRTSENNDFVPMASAPSELSRTQILEYILSDDLQKLDSTLPSTIQELKNRNAHKCWHKHSTFLQHLVGVNNILRLWGQSEIMGRVGLLHSAYSNSYVNLALFDPMTERHTMQSLIGRDAEKLVHVFCIIDRQNVVVNTLLKEGRIPPDGLIVPHLRYSNETVYLSPEFLRALLTFTMADIADQYFGWQDILFDGIMLKFGEDDVSRHNPNALWPGISKPGLWMNYVSKLCAVARTYEGETGGQKNSLLPPVFGNCTVAISEQDEAFARDLYWEVSHGQKISFYGKRMLQ